MNELLNDELRLKLIEDVPRMPEKKEKSAGPLVSTPSLRKGPPELEAFERERQAFLRIKDSLLDNPEFRGKFVAIYEGNIVDQDEDNRELARRVYSEYGYVPIYIGKVERERRVTEMPSPEGL